MSSIKVTVSLVFSVLLLVALTLGTIPVRAQTQPPNDAPTPEGVSADDWAQIDAILPESNAAFQLDAYLKASNTNSKDKFGSEMLLYGAAGKSIGFSGDTLVVAAPGEDSNATGVDGDQTNNQAADSGAAYVFVRTGNTWSQQAYLKASNTAAGDKFGSVVAISGDTIVIGACFEDSNAKGVNGNQSDNSALDAGAAYVFVRSGVAWSQQAYLKASNTGAGDFFGCSATIEGDTIVVGAPMEDSDATGVNGPRQGSNSFKDSGAAYIFKRSGVTWTQDAYVKASDPSLGDNYYKWKDMFGGALAISGDTLVIGAGGAYTTVDGNKARCGAAYVFVRIGGIWSQQAKLNQTKVQSINCSENYSTRIDFGDNLAISGDTLALGACGEDSKAVGINGNQNAGSAEDAGAVYVFVRNGTTWSEQAYLKESDTEHLDHFCAVSLSGDTLAVGAMRYSAPSRDAGAVYLFGRVGTTWNQISYLKAPTHDSMDFFGAYTVLDGSTLLVTMPGDDSNAIGINGGQTNNSANDAGAVYVFNLHPHVVNSLPGNTNPTTAASVDFAVTFSEAMTGVDMSDFVLATAGVTGASITGVSGGPQTYTITVNTGSDDGTLRLNVVDDDSILNASSVPLGGAGAGNGFFSNGTMYIVRPSMQTFTSQGNQDGWVLAKAFNQRVGGSMDSSAGVLILGNNVGDNKEYRSILHFNTSSLPDTAVITNASLQIKKHSITGDDPFTTLGALRVDMSKPNFGDSRTLETIDFEAVPSVPYLVGYFFTSPINNWYRSDLTYAGKTNINLVGTTQFRLRFTRRVKTDLFKFYSGNAVTSANRPMLLVEYYVP